MGLFGFGKRMEEETKAVANMNLDAKVEYITDMEKVMSYGVMSMPAIVVRLTFTFLSY